MQCHSNPFKPFSINIRGKLTEYERPAVMGIINATPDSFYGTSRLQNSADISRRAAHMVECGADMIDIGAYSSRPGAADVSTEEEVRRAVMAVKAVRSACPETPISIDTFRAVVAESAAEAGADIINDISGGTLDDDMIPTVARLGLPYILMHMRGTPATMSQLTDYSPKTVTEAVITWLAERVNVCVEHGMTDIIVDPGFGFAKTLEQNYELMRGLPLMTEALELPVLVGVSRKSMITKPLNITAAQALVPTTAVNTMALMLGASILRVHDVKAGVQTVALTQQLYAL